MLAQFQDVTEKKHFEESLKIEEERYRIIADFNYDWEFWISQTGNLVYVSPSSERITGYTPAEFLQESKLLTTIVHPEDRETFLCHMLEYINEYDDTIHSLDFRIIKRNGTGYLD